MSKTLRKEGLQGQRMVVGVRERRPSLRRRHLTVALHFGELFSLQVLSDSATPWTAARQASLTFTVSQFAQTHVYQVNDAIQPSHPLSSPSPPTFNLSQHQG